MKFRTRAIHVGNTRDKETGEVVPPIQIASTFVQPAAGEFGDFDYSRSGNPTRNNLESTIASLENGSNALAFSTGMAAIHAATMLLENGDHIIAGTDIYGGAYRLFHKIATKAGIEITLVDTTNPANLDGAYRDNTKLLWLESPGNPLMSITDLRACADWAKQKGILSGVDNTIATPALTRPLELGIDIVMHSATKYLGGHSDALGGVLVVNEKELYERLWYIQNATGAVMSAFDSFLISRGTKTLDLRVRQQSENAMQIANFLSAHESVATVNYPGLGEHPGHELAKQQMDGVFGAMLSFEVVGDIDATKKVVDSCKLFQLAVSLGAVESLVEQPATMSHASYDKADRMKHGISDELIRLSVGLEDVNDLIDDLAQALSAF